jgi:hypothetical protein
VATDRLGSAWVHSVNVADHCGCGFASGSVERGFESPAGSLELPTGFPRDLGVRPAGCLAQRFTSAVNRCYRHDRVAARPEIPRIVARFARGLRLRRTWRDGWDPLPLFLVDTPDVSARTAIVRDIRLLARERHEGGSLLPTLRTAPTGHVWKSAFPARNVPAEPQAICATLPAVDSFVRPKAWEVIPFVSLDRADRRALNSPARASLEAPSRKVSTCGYTRTSQTRRPEKHTGERSHRATRETLMCARERRMRLREVM